MARFVHVESELIFAASSPVGRQPAGDKYEKAPTVWVCSVKWGILMKKLLGFIKKDDGVVAIEWVGIAAIVLVAAIAIAGSVASGSFQIGEAVETEAETASGTVASAPGLDCWKTDGCD